MSFAFTLMAVHRETLRPGLGIKSLLDQSANECYDDLESGKIINFANA